MPAVAIPTPTKPLLRGYSHLLAFVSALTLAPIMIVIAPAGWPRAVIAIHAVAICAMFGVSALYHRGRWSARSLGVVRRLDHSMIFLAIAGTYTPVAVFGLPSTAAWIVLSIVWVGSLVGIIARITWTNAPSAAVAIPYVIVGWACLPVIHSVWQVLGVAGFVLLLTGGLFYTVGAVVYALRAPDPWPRTFGFHEIFHLFVVAGAAVHYVAVAFVALPQA